MKYLAFNYDEYEKAKKILEENGIKYDEEPYAWDLAFKSEIRYLFSSLSDDVIEDIANLLADDDYISERMNEWIVEEVKTYMKEKYSTES